MRSSARRSSRTCRRSCLPEAERRELNDGRDFSLVDGSAPAARASASTALRPDTIVVFDTHWFTTFEHIVSAHERRTGIYTSDELPRGMPQMPYDLAGRSRAGRRHRRAGRATGTTPGSTPRDDPYIAIHYPTINLLPFLQRDERWVSVGICQTATVGRLPALRRAAGRRRRRARPPCRAARQRRVVAPLLAAARTSPARVRRARAHPQRRGPGGRRAADRPPRARRPRRACWPDYAGVPDVSPEGFFAHYLMMVGAHRGRRPAELAGGAATATTNRRPARVRCTSGSTGRKEAGRHEAGEPRRSRDHRARVERHARASTSHEASGGALAAIRWCSATSTTTTRCGRWPRVPTRTRLARRSTRPSRPARCRARRRASASRSTTGRTRIESRS